MQILETYTGKVVGLAEPPEYASIKLTEVSTGKTSDTVIEVKRLEEKGIKVGDEFKVEIQKVSETKIEAVMTKV